MPESRKKERRKEGEREKVCKSPTIYGVKLSTMCLTTSEPAVLTHDLLTTTCVCAKNLFNEVRKARKTRIKKASNMRTTKSKRIEKREK